MRKISVIINVIWMKKKNMMMMIDGMSSDTPKLINSNMFELYCREIWLSVYIWATY